MTLCFFRNLPQQPFLPGLAVAPFTDATPDPEAFGCCKLQGMYYDAIANGVRRCDLPQRLTLVNDVLRQFNAIWPEQPIPLEPDPAHQAWMIRWLTAAQKTKNMRGAMVKKRDVGPTVLWQFALASAWRLNLRPHVVNLVRTKSHQFLPKALDVGVVFLEGVTDLWDRDRAADFEIVVNWCDKAGIPLWLALPPSLSVPRGEAAKARPATLAAAFERKLAKIKGRSPLSWLGDDVRSRLTAICTLPPGS